MIDLYSGYCRRHLVTRAGPAMIDHTAGGFYVFDVRTRPGVPSRGLQYLPGADALVWEVMRPPRSGEDPDRGLHAANALVQGHPEIAQFRELRGRIEYQLGFWSQAYRDLGAAMAGGFVGDFTAGLAAAAAVNMREPDLADPLVAKARAVYPGQIETLQGLSAAIMGLRARRGIESGRLTPGEAVSMARRAAALTDPGPPLVRLCLGAVLCRAGMPREGRGVLHALLAALPPGSDLRRECESEIARGRSTLP